MKTTFKIITYAFTLWVLSMVIYKKHYYQSEQAYKGVMTEIPPDSIKPIRVDPRVFKRKDTTRYKGNWVDINQ